MLWNRGSIMHTKLSKPPVTYVLAQITFSSVEDIASYVPQLQDKIRENFPHYQEVNIQTVQLRGGQQPITTTLIQWHFMDKEKHTGIILDKQTITIHTSRYDQFQPLLDSFETVVTRFNEVLNISLFTRLGLRYINLIEDGLTKMSAGLQGFQLTGNGFKENQFLARTETTQRSQEGVVKVQVTRIGDKQVVGNIQSSFVPQDLVSTARLLSFKHHREPQQGFLVLDVDHVNNDQGDFDITKILERFHHLQDAVYQAFRQAVGKENLKNWK